MSELTERHEALEDLHDNADPWRVDTLFYERRKRALTLAALPRERFARALEVGCSVGALAADLAPRCDELVAVDLSEKAVARASERLSDLPQATARRLHVPHDWPEGEWDLVMVSEMGYFLRPDELAGLTDRLRDSLTDDGVVVLCHWLHPIEGWFLQGEQVHEHVRALPWLEVLVTHREPDFALDVLQRPGRPSPAAADGLLA